jgi:hypothetical protein
MTLLHLASCYLAGMAIANWGAPRQGVAYRLALALPFGLGAWAWFCVVLVLLLSAPYHNRLYVLAFAVIAAAAYIAAVRVARPAALDHLFLAVAVGAAILIATQVSMAFFSPDSFVMHYMADQIAVHSAVTDEVRRHLLLQYPLMQTLIALPALAGQPHVPPAPILNTPLVITMHCMAALGLVAWRIVGRSFADRTAGVVFCVVLPLSLLLSRHMTLQVFYFNNHILAGFCFLMLAVAVRSPAETGLRPGVILLAAYATLLVARVETIVFLALVPFVFGGPGGATPDMRRAWAGGAILTTLLLGYYLAGAVVLPENLELVSPVSWLIQIAIAWGVWFALLELRLSQFAFKLAIPAFICGCAALFVFGFWRNAPAMASGIDAVFHNIIGFRGQWDFTWTVLLALTAVGGVLMRTAVLRNRWLVYTGLFFLALVAINAFRLDHPYRYNWWDSGARMAVHVLPIAAIGVACLWRELIVSRTRAGRLVFEDVAKSP